MAYLVQLAQWNALQLEYPILRQIGDSSWITDEIDGFTTSLDMSLRTPSCIDGVAKGSFRRLHMRLKMTPHAEHGTVSIIQVVLIVHLQRNLISAYLVQT